MATTPDSPTYDLSYVGTKRFYSYAHQLSAAIAFRPKNVLEIGVGTRFVAQALRLFNVPVTTVDVEALLKPDIVADVVNIPVEDDAFEVSLCCQVLEHLPFDRFGAALRELRRVTSLALVLSLPDLHRYFELSLRLPRVGRRRLTWNPSRPHAAISPPQRLKEMGHHWEIGYREYPLRRIRAEITKAGWGIEKTWRVPELPWHRFFVLTKPHPSA